MHSQIVSKEFLIYFGHAIESTEKKFIIRLIFVVKRIDHWTFRRIQIREPNSVTM